MSLAVVNMLLGDGEEVSSQCHKPQRLAITGKLADQGMLEPQETLEMQAMLVSPLQGCVIHFQGGPEVTQVWQAQQEMAAREGRGVMLEITDRLVEMEERVEPEAATAAMDLVLIPLDLHMGQWVVVELVQ
jgi:hypothetical protein